MSFLATAAAAAGGGAAAAASMASGAPARSKRANGGKWRRQRQRRPASRSVDGALWNRIGIEKKTGVVVAAKIRSSESFSAALHSSHPFTLCPC